LEGFLELLGAILMGLVALFGVGFGTVFAANVGETRESEADGVFLVVG